MTEQIERELAELFHERADRLDVLPPLPAARVRRVRLQAALAMASVVAVLAAAGVAGVRLSSGPSGGQVSFAGSGSARAALDRVFELVRAGRWQVTGTARVTTAAGPDSAGNTSTYALDVRYDGQTKTGIARQNGEIVALAVDGVSYIPLNVAPDVAALLPKGARWQRLDPDSAPGADPVAPVIAGLGSGGTSSDPGGLSGRPRPTEDGLAHSKVRRTSTGFRIESSDGFGSSRVDLSVRSDGSISSMHAVASHRFPQTMPGSMSGMKETTVLDAVFAPLASPVRVTAPNPATVITATQLGAALQKAFANGTADGTPCPVPMTPSPAVARHRTNSGGTGIVVNCHPVTAVTVTATPVASPSPH